jgi:signal transduction histidine kinase
VFEPWPPSDTTGRLADDPPGTPRHPRSDLAAAGTRSPRVHDPAGPMIVPVSLPLGDTRRHATHGIHGVTRRRPLVAEVALFAGAFAVDEVMSGRFGLHGAGGVPSTILVVAVLALTLLRRHWSSHRIQVGGCVIGLSLVHSAVALLDRLGVLALPVGFSLTEVVAVAVIAGSLVRNADRWSAVGLVAAAGAATTSAPFAWAATGLDVEMFAVPGALLWGVALAFGLVLRDSDARRAAALTDQRRAERMRIARELHDFVTHHVTAITVRAQAAQMVAAKAPDIDHRQAYEEIQEAAAASLTAMRRMVGMLRADEDTLPTAATGIEAILADVVRSDPRVTITVTDAAAGRRLGPDVSATLHWIMLEAFTNIRRHAGDARGIRVSVRVDNTVRPESLVLDITNDGVTPRNNGDATPHYGLIGMRERLTALDGTLHVGPEQVGRWRVSASLPLIGKVSAR